MGDMFNRKDKPAPTPHPFTPVTDPFRRQGDILITKAIPRYSVDPRACAVCGRLRDDPVHLVADQDGPPNWG